LEEIFLRRAWIARAGIALDAASQLYLSPSRGAHTEEPAPTGG